MKSICPSRCTGCGICIESCPAHALSRGLQGHQRRPDLCRHCGHCVEVCPMEARESTGWTVGVPELMQSIERDIPFFDQSGGGVTFSGGEPLCQPDFLLAMLEACGRCEIHRAVDTSGYGDAAVLLKAAELTDLFLYDLKVLDPQKHRANTGVDNRRILANLRHALRIGRRHHHPHPVDPGGQRRRRRHRCSRRVHRRTAAAAPGAPAALSPRRQTANTASSASAYRGENVLPPSRGAGGHAAHQLSDFGLSSGSGRLRP